MLVFARICSYLFHFAGSDVLGIDPADSPAFSMNFEHDLGSPFPRQGEEHLQHLYHELTDTIERRWDDRFTPGVTGALRASLEPLAAGQPPVLSAGLQPYPDNWRASVRRPATLPHFPMVLHRGGYPDGS